MPHNEEIILGIDPGTRILGYGIISAKGKKVALVDFGVINLSKEGSHFLVLQKIIAEISKLIRKYKPHLMAIEAPFYGKNPQVMLKLGRAQGAAISAALLKDIPIFEYAPRSVKLAITGRGAASKEQVSQMVQHILNFNCEIKYLDATDALAIALTHYYSESSLVTISAQEDNRIKLYKLGQNLIKKNVSKSLGVGKRGVKSIKSKGHKNDWDEFVKTNPRRIK